MEVPPLIAYVAAYFALFGAIYVAFNASDDLLKRETKKRIGRWIGKPKIGKRLFDQEWVTSFLEFFDTVFVPPERYAWRFPLPGFWRSAALSIVFVVLWIILFYTFSENVRNDRVFRDGGFIDIPLMALALNVIPDYLSIIETRFVLKKMRISQKPWTWIILDAIITFFLPYMSIIVLQFIWSILFHPVVFVDMAQYISYLLFFQNAENYLAAMIYSTFLTSIWIWLYTFGGILTGAGRRFNGFRQFLDRHVRLEEKPLSVMGWMLIATMTLAFAAYLGLLQATA